MIYKAFIAQKVIALLLHEFFSGELLQNITPVKHGNLRFYGFTMLSVVRFLQTTEVCYFYVLKRLRLR